LTLSFQNAPSSESLEISAARLRFRSTSKRPPERLEAPVQVLDDGVGRSRGHAQRSVVLTAVAGRRRLQAARASAPAVNAAHAQAKESPIIV